MSSFPNEILMKIPRAPRNVRRATSTGCALAIPRLFVLYMAVVALQLLIRIPCQLYTAKHGRLLQATVDRRDTATTPKGSQLLRIYYNYQINGVPFHADHSVDKNQYDELRPGAHFPIRASLILGFPIVVIPELDTYSMPGAIFLPILWCALIGAFLSFICIHPWLEKRLIANGECTLATITGRRELKGRGVVYTLSYTFDTSTGQHISDHSNVSQMFYSETPLFAQILVFYNPKHPRRNIVYDSTEFIIS